MAEPQQTGYDFWAALGVGTFPLQDKGKNPLVSELPDKSWSGFVDNPAPAEKRAQWAAKHMNYGVISGSKLLVLDWENEVDIFQLFKKWDEFCAVNYVVKTGKGYHIYFLCDWNEPYAQIKRGKDLICEVRTGAHYVVGAGSTHPSGKIYTSVGAATPMKMTEKRWNEFREQLAEMDYEYKKTGEAEAAPEDPETASLADILKHADSDEKFKKLMDGDISDYQSRSEAEMGLACKLIYYRATKEQVFAAMKKSKIGKWATAPKGYKELTYEKAKKFQTDRVPIEQKVDSGDAASSFMHEGEVVRFRIPKQIKRDDEGVENVVSQYVFTNQRCYMEKLRSWTIRGRTYTELLFEDVIRAEMRIISRVEYAFAGDKNVLKWHVDYGGLEFTGKLDEIVDLVYCSGRAIADRTEARKAVMNLISYVEANNARKIAYPAVGFYLTADGHVRVADSKETITPTNDAQQGYFDNYALAMSRVQDDWAKEALNASMQFIHAMPKKNMAPALIARAYCCAAPIGFMIKQTRVQVFPYLYLCGERGSSKTQIAMVSAMYPFGETQPLNSESMSTGFRLGIEYTATTMPRVIDEAQDLFVKEISVFKSSATTTLATKRGTKERKLDSYPSFASFVFTSNNIPIAPEDDQQGALSDRLLMLQAYKGADFKVREYQTAMKILQTKSAGIGKRLIEYYKEKFEAEGFEPTVTKFEMYAQMFQDKDPRITLRRGYCLASVAIGMGTYRDIFRREGLLFDFEHLFVDEKNLIDFIYYNLETTQRSEEFAKLINFIEWVGSISSNDKKIGEIGAVVEFKRETIAEGAGIGKPKEWYEMHVTNNTFKAYQNYTRAKTPPYQTLTEFHDELVRFGCTPKLGSKWMNNMTARCVSLDMSQYSEQLKDKTGEV